MTFTPTTPIFLLPNNISYHHRTSGESSSKDTSPSPKATLLTLALGRTEDLTPSTTILPDFPLPKLAALSLELCRLDEDEVAYFGAMLTSRARHGLAPKIDISECRGFNEGNIEDLSKTLTEEIAVRWDGVEDSDEEEEEEEEEHMGA